MSGHYIKECNTGVLLSPIKGLSSHHLERAPDGYQQFHLWILGKDFIEG